ncbi:hypothetical protein IFM89_013151 [Coptis chinensis]|uniref:Zinc finger ZPR1-type domain-containing protein n=1 Tax=Coptis chinensis TaxID=261450 RepID=A0A835M605_9MAGN|nr:hypothetical protein IFM89_013151 [Coptis chinensis]
MDPMIDIGSAVNEIHQIESLCMRCGENGTTKILLTRIPHFRDLVLMAFDCPHCNERNNEVQFAGQLQPRGRTYHLRVASSDKNTLDRHVVKSDSATIKIPHLDFEIPPEAQRGTLSTVEGILMRAVNELEELQEERRKIDPGKAKALDEFLVKLKECASGAVPFDFILDDPTNEQQEALGFLVEAKNQEGSRNVVPHGTFGAAATHKAIAHGNNEDFTTALLKYSAPEEVMTFPSTCGLCGIPCETRMFVTKIPYFREVIVMASTCDGCGDRSSELKAGGDVPDKGKKIVVNVKNRVDLNRDVIKSDYASVTIPELDLELGSGTLGGMVTTIEGLITQIGENLDNLNSLHLGDSTTDGKKSEWKDFKSRLSQLLDIEEPWTLIIDDALARSFVSPVTDVIEDDHQLNFEDYERSWEQNEELGLNDIDTSAADIYYDDSKTSK